MNWKKGQVEVRRPIRSPSERQLLWRGFQPRRGKWEERSKWHKLHKDMVIDFIWDWSRGTIVQDDSLADGKVRGKGLSKGNGSDSRHF